MTHTRSWTPQAFSIAIAFFVLLFSTAQAQAYFTTGQKEIALGNGSGLFLIEYQFGMQNYEVSLPTLAYNTEEKTDSSVSYEILNKSDESVSGTVTGVVLSTADITNDAMYVTHKGQSKKFTLAVLFTPKKHIKGEQYRLHVTNLPFQFDTVNKLHLNPSELIYYKTDLISL